VTTAALAFPRPPRRLDSAVLAAALALLAALVFSACGCGLTAREVATAGLEGANAAIVAAARDVDAQETIDEQHCAAAPACIAATRGRWNPVLEAYDRYRIAWTLLVDVWNRSAPAPATAAEVDAAAAQARAAEASFYAAQAQARAVAP
jgi:hypothetical protein